MTAFGLCWVDEQEGPSATRENFMFRTGWNDLQIATGEVNFQPI